MAVKVYYTILLFLLPVFILSNENTDSQEKDYRAEIASINPIVRYEKSIDSISLMKSEMDYVQSEIRTNLQIIKAQQFIINNYKATNNE